MPTSSRVVVRTATALALVVGGLLATTTHAAAAPTPTPTTLPTTDVGLTSPRGMVYAHDQLFVSAGDTVSVLGTDGTVRSRIGDLPGASDVIASSTGAQVYVAVRGADAVAVVDTTTLAVRRWPVSPCPADLAAVGQRLFFSYGCDAGEGGIASVDLSRGGAVVPSGVDDYFSNAPQLGGGGDVLVAGSVGESPAALFSYRSSGPDLTRLATNADGSYLSDLAVSPDGTRVYTSGGYPQDLTNLSATTLVAGTEYATGAWPSGVAVDADGSMIAAGTTNQANLVVFAKGSTEPVVAGSAHPREEYNQPQALPRTVTFSADGSRVFALVGTSEHTYLTSSPTRTGQAPSDLRLTVDQPDAPGAPARLTATLAGRAGVTVELRTRTADGTSSAARVVTDAAGKAVLEQVLAAGTTVFAAYAGDDAHQAAQSDTVTVLDFTRLTLGKVTSPSGRSGTLTATATLAAPRAGAQVTFTLDQPGEPTGSVTVPTDAKGVARLSEHVTAGGRLSAAYGGDETHQPSVTKRARWTVASRTRATLGGTHTVKHHKLRFTKASRVFLDVVVDPSTATEVEVALQRRSGKHWKTVAASTEQLEDGTLTLQLYSVKKRKDHRFVVAYPGDDLTRSSRATSKTFVVG